MGDKLAPEKRFKVIHNGQEVYEWDQTIDEVNIYIKLPPGVPARMFSCAITARHVTVAIKGNPPYLDHQLPGPVKGDASFWTIEDGTMHITLGKAEVGRAWPSAVAGQGQLDPYAADQEARRLMLERFQEEHAGFDFSGAQVTGVCPDPATFLGGMKAP